MEQFFSTIPSTPFGWIALLAFAVFTVAQLMLLIRRNDITALRENNEDLRGANQDNKKEIDQLRHDIKELSTQVAELQASNTTLQEIVNVALKEYFAENPQVVVQLSKSIKTKV